jgi:hypothetical protein
MIQCTCATRSLFNNDTGYNHSYLVLYPSLSLALFDHCCAVQTYQSKFYDSSGNKEGESQKGTFYGPAFYISVFLGFYLLTSRAVDLLFVFLPKHWLARKGIVQKLITPGNIQAESRMKRGASYKVMAMVNNALSCRPGYNNNNNNNNKNTNDSSTSSSVRRSAASRRAAAADHNTSSPTEKALMNYNLSLAVKEQVGGIVWAWRRVLTGKIYSEEGIWLHGEYTYRKHWLA